MVYGAHFVMYLLFIFYSTLGEVLCQLADTQTVGRAHYDLSHPLIAKAQEYFTR